MNPIYYIGLDSHKETIAYYVKKVDGTLVRQGTVCAERKLYSSGNLSFQVLGTVQWKQRSSPAGSMTSSSHMPLISR